MAPTNDIVTTGVDSLIKLLRKKGKASLESAAKELQVSEKLLQHWVDFLVEERIVGVEYKFVTPYIYLINQSDDSLDIKEDFFLRAKAKGFTDAKTEELWQEYLLNHMGSIKEQFFNRALQRNITPQKLDELWIKYKRMLVNNEH